MIARAVVLFLAALALGCAASEEGDDAALDASRRAAPWIVVLGVAQDGGAPQAGDRAHPGWKDPARRRHATSLGLVDPRSGERWLLDATPDLPAQLHRLDELAPPGDVPPPALDGVFLTHAHVGHYTGLLFLGHEVMGAHRVPVHAMPRMAHFLRTSGPWSLLVERANVELRDLAAGEPARLAEDLLVTPIPVPHRQELSEVVAFRIEGPRRSVLFLPDIDSWEEWDAWSPPGSAESDGSPGSGRLEAELARVDVAYLDGTFFAEGELPGRDMSGFPHPTVSHTIERLSGLPASERVKVRFVHLNHTNPALHPDSPARRAVEAAGMRVAREGEIVEL